MSDTFDERDIIYVGIHTIDNKEGLKVGILCAGCDVDCGSGGTVENPISRGKYHCEVVWTRSLFFYPGIDDWCNPELSPVSRDIDVGDI